MRGLATVLLLLLANVAVSQEPADTNYDESKVPAYELPDPLIDEDGQPIKDAEMWRSKRRGELLQAFATHVYGRTPDIETQLQFKTVSTKSDALGGLATRKEITIQLFDDAESPRIHLLLYLPNAASKPVPVFLGLNYYGNECVDPDPTITPSDRWMRPTSEMGIVGNRSTAGTRGAHASKWPLELVLKRGYAVATFYYGDVEPDFADGWQQGVRGYLLVKRRSEPNLQTTIGERSATWAWGLSRAGRLPADRSRYRAAKNCRVWAFAPGESGALGRRTGRADCADHFQQFWARRCVAGEASFWGDRCCFCRPLWLLVLCQLSRVCE